MKTIFNQAVSVDAVDPLLGIEIELENCLPDYYPKTEAFTQLWEAVSDGSLRGNYGTELRFRSGYHRPNQAKAIKAIKLMLENKDVYKTRRCSTHVHVNLKGLSRQNIVTFMALTLLCEPVLYKMVDPIRENSVFCRPSWDTGAQVYRVFSTILADYSYPINHMCKTMNKYAGVNFRSYVDHGTLEFRMAPAPRSCQDVLTWINVIVAIYAAANQLMDKPVGAWMPLFMEDYKTNTAEIFKEVELSLTPDELVDCEAKAMTAFKVISYYGGF